MYLPGQDPMFWVSLILVTVCIILLFVGTEVLVRRVVKVDEMGWFGKWHVNELHKRVDFWAAIILVVSGIAVITVHLDNMVVVAGVFITMGLVTELIEVFFYWKYADNRKTYLLPLSRIFLVLALSAVFFLYIMPTFFS